MEAPLRFIDPKILSRISNLSLLARTVVEGFITGLHKSPYKGASVEFMSYRSYIPGDDPMHIDWKLYGRTDKLYVKEFEDDTNTRFNLMVDISPSMTYTSNGVSKWDYAFYLAASLAYFMNRQQDAVGLTFFDETVTEHIPPRRASGHLLTMLQHMHRATVGKPTGMEKPLHQLADMQRRRGFMVIISDLLDDPVKILDGLKHFRYDGHNVLVFHLFDPQELTFDFEDMVEFEDLETGEKMVVVAEDARDLYLANLKTYKDTLIENCGRLGVDYYQVDTSEPLDRALFKYLAARQKHT